MRPFEILTLILISGTLIALFTHKERKVFLYLLFGSIVVMFLQYFLEGHRWQFALAVYLLPAMYTFHRFQQPSINIITKGFLSVWFFLAVLLPWIIPVFSLPTPEGPYSIGTEIFHWVDSSRTEWFTDEDPNDMREIIVQVWYPAKMSNDLQPEPYLDFIDLRAKTLAGAGAIPEFFPSHLNHIFTNSFKNIPIIKSDQLMPVVIFSHGITGTRHLHQALYEHLVSHGYIVVAPDHSFDANLTIFPDGHMADYRSNITGHPDSVNVRTMQMDTRAADISFILDQIEKMQSGEIESQINRKIDLEKIAVGGHSYGGSTAMVASQRDERINACFVLDSWISPVPQETIEAGVHVPFLFMGRPTWQGSDYPGNYPRLDSLMVHSSDPKYRLIIKETEHLDFSDIPLFSPLIGYVLDVGSLSASVSIPLMNELIHGFLEKYLRNLESSKFDSTLQNNLIISIQ
jgi:pimeloyl-ACP methyl ester carboxylesterase